MVVSFLGYRAKTSSGKQKATCKLNLAKMPSSGISGWFSVLDPKRVPENRKLHVSQIWCKCQERAFTPGLAYTPLPTVFLHSLYQCHPLLQNRRHPICSAPNNCFKIIRYNIQ